VCGTFWPGGVGWAEGKGFDCCSDLTNWNEVVEKIVPGNTNLQGGNSKKEVFTRGLVDKKTTTAKDSRNREWHPQRRGGDLSRQVMRAFANHTYQNTFHQSLRSPGKKRTWLPSQNHHPAEERESKERGGKREAR